MKNKSTSDNVTSPFVAKHSSDVIGVLSGFDRWRWRGTLRAHGILRKVGGTHRYHLTQRGRTLVTALLAAREADTEQLSKLAA